MNNFILDNIQWILSGIFVVSGWLVVLWTERIYAKSEKTAREMTNKAHVRIDAVEDTARELVILRNSDIERQNKSEQIIMDLLRDLQQDVKELLGHKK